MMERDRELHEMADEGRALMSDYIKREDAINTKNYLKRFGCFGDYGFVEIEGVLIALSKIPSADVAPVRHGRWVVIDAEEPRRYGCSECKRLSWNMENYCGNCGAEMSEDTEY